MDAYTKPELKVILFQLSDVISSSGECTHYTPQHCEPMCPIEGPGECMLGDDD